MPPVSERIILAQKLAQIYRVQQLTLTTEEGVKAGMLNPCIESGLRRCLRGLNTEIIEMGYEHLADARRGMAIIDWRRKMGME